MKVTIYTTSTCEYSKKEIEYFKAKNVAYEEKNIETNKDFLNEMMTVGNNFAGTPVTKIEKDDGTIAVLKGFTVEEFDTALGFAPEKPVGVAPAAPVAAPVNDTPVPPTTPPVVEKPEEKPLNDVMDKLASNMAAPTAAPSMPTPPPETPPIPTPTPPETPTPDAGTLPPIPDFPTGDAKTTA